MDFRSVRHTSTPPPQGIAPTTQSQRKEPEVAAESSSTKPESADQSRARDAADRGNEIRIRQQLGKHPRSGSDSPPSGNVKHHKEGHATAAASAAVSSRATRDDIPGVMEFIQNLDEDSYNKRFPVGSPREEAMEVIGDDMSRTPEKYFIARVNDKVVGFADYERVDHEFASAHVACINIVLNAEQHGKGIGKQLAGQMIQQLREDGFQYTVGRVHVDNTSVMQGIANKGWKETSESLSGALEDVDYREFWVALDPNLTQIEPQRLPNP